MGGVAHHSIASTFFRPCGWSPITLSPTRFPTVGRSCRLAASYTPGRHQPPFRPSKPQAAVQLVAGGRPGRERAARDERSSERGRGAQRPHRHFTANVFRPSVGPVAWPLATRLAATSHRSAVQAAGAVQRRGCPERARARTSGAANGGGRSAPDPAHFTTNAPYGCPDPDDVLEESRTVSAPSTRALVL